MSSRVYDSAACAVRLPWQGLATRASYDLDAAAHLLGISLRSLERLCQRDLGCTPSEWLQCERMGAAAELLTAGQPAKVVALRLGYSQLANFSRDFKRHHGRSPTRFAPRPRLILAPEFPTPA